MDADKFCYWLQGFVELADTPTISEAQWKMVKEHLQLVFKKVTPLPSIQDSIKDPILQPPITTLPYMPPTYMPTAPVFEPRITCSTELGSTDLTRTTIC